MHHRKFEKLVAEGLDALPPHIHARMDNVVIVIEKEPTEAQRKENHLGESDVLFGLYEGLPLTERGVDYSAPPDKITIFRKPILEAYSDPNDIRACVMNTVWHEVAHHFGMDEAHVGQEEIKRGKVL